MLKPLLASDLISSNTLEYAKSCLNSFFPSVIDGLKNVKRRILYTQPLDDIVSGVELVSNTLRIHPFGDASIYDTAGRMTCEFINSHPLLVIIGKGGTYSGDVVASARYVKFKLSDFCKDVFFRGIKFKTIPMRATEDLQGSEIVYFIPKLPTALLYANESVGFGYSSRTVPLDICNVCKLVESYIKSKNRTAWNPSNMPEWFIPRFPIEVYIKNHRDLLSAYKAGKYDAPIITEGKYCINTAHSVTVRTMGYGTAPSAVLAKLTDLVKNKHSKIAHLDCRIHTLADSKHYADFQISVKHGVNIFEAIDTLRPVLGLIQTTRPINNYVHNDKMVVVDPPGVVVMWYHERYRSVLGTKKHKQQELLLNKLKYETYMVICEHVDEVVELIRSSDERTVYTKLRERFDLTTRQCEILLKANLNTLMKSKRAELEEALNKVTRELEELNASFANIDKEILAEVVQLRNKYGKAQAHQSVNQKFIGCLIVGELGIVQVQDLSTVVYTAKLFSGIRSHFISYYDGGVRLKFAKSPIWYRYPEDAPTTVSAKGVIVDDGSVQVFTRSPSGYTQLIKASALQRGADGTIINPLYSDGIVAITADGKLESLQSTKPPRVIYMYDRSDNGLFVLSVNDAHKTTIRVQRITKDTKQIYFSKAGKTDVIAVVPDTTDELLVNLPSTHKYSIMHITGLIHTMKKDNLVDMSFRTFNKA